MFASLLVIGCHSKHSTMESPDADLGPDASAAGGTCHAVVTHETPLQAASHVTQGSVVEWMSNPPSSGAHYPTLVEWTTASPAALMRGNYLHNEEHGGVVLLFNCPTGCGDPLADLTSFGKALPQDPICKTINARYIVSPDPLLPTGVAIAAATWGWTYKADCFDPATLGAFVATHYAQGGSDRTN